VTALSDATLRSLVMTGALGVSPMRPEAIQPASIDLHLGDTLLVQEYGTTVDPEADQSNTWRTVDRNAPGRWFIGGMRLYLGATAERLRIPDDHIGLLSGISSLGRLGLIPHAQAGLLDPGYVGNPTLELVLFGQAAWLRPGMRIAQLVLYRLDQPAEHPYSGRYQKDDAPTPARVKKS
jgi:dCTP deaminase